MSITTSEEAVSTRVIRLQGGGLRFLDIHERPGKDFQVVTRAYRGVDSTQHWPVTDLGSGVCTIQHVGSGARVVLTSPSALQVHPSPAPAAALVQHDYVVDEEGELQCQWDPVIPFAAARLEQRFALRLAESSRLYWSDALMAGRVGRGEAWRFQSLAHELSVRVGDALAYTICERSYLTIGMGVGSELRKPLGTAIVGVLIVSQILTLYSTPVIYLALDRLRQRKRSGRRTLLIFDPRAGRRQAAVVIRRVNRAALAQRIDCLRQCEGLRSLCHALKLGFRFAARQLNAVRLQLAPLMVDGIRRLSGRRRNTALT